MMANQRMNITILSLCKKMSLLRFSGTPIRRNVSSCNMMTTRIPVHLISPTSSTDCEYISKINFNLNNFHNSLAPKEYICPNLEKNLDIAILDKSRIESHYDCPTILNTVQDIIAPHNNKINIIKPPPNTDNATKQARNIMKIRRRKMNRHLLKKFRKRDLYKARARTLLSNKKKERLFKAHLKTFTDWAENFEAETFVKSELEKARKGGFYVDIYETRDKKITS